ncbi:flavin monoamine oxidase family protein [Pseudoduganella namucuonensis]|uniref:Monoamine oxidase n=1 Tax=Pseudoduganella namucuonensis TaxID=1035707 RepID=A0A1I7LZ54_9BURK|nr:NAD(P)/FAD-dependent oxidoreductase [Pseudoduganella namucuonensis]SFV14984.1 Monoamine oxidase [Pseudoduganella namucuonensis]
MEKENKRRRFLKAGGLAVAGAGLASRKATAGEAALDAARSAQVPDGAEYDVIVIGAGFAGLTAARDLSLRGARTLLLEARNRIGGRTFSTRYAGHKIELGGTWIHWSQGYVWSEVNRYGLGIVESPGASPDDLALLSDGRLRKLKPEAAFPRLSEAMGRYCDVDGKGGSTIFPRAQDPLFSNAFMRFDRLSLQDRLDQLRLKDDTRAMVGSMLAINCHNDPRQGGFVDMLKWWSLGDFEMGRLFDKLSRYKIAEGTGALASAMLGDAKADLLLSTPVSSVGRGGGMAVVTTTEGKSFKARAVVCAVPMNVLDAIAFSPDIANAKRAASRAGHTGNGGKFYAHIKQKVGNWMGMSPFPNPITMAWTERQRDDGTLLVCFSPPGKLDQNDEEAVQAALRGLLPGAEVLATMGYQWGADPYSKGTWCWYRPNQLSHSFAELRRIEGNVFFASADSAKGWRGFIDGAIESGAETAHEVIGYLRGKA